MKNLLRSCLILILIVGLTQCDDIDLSAGEDVSVAGFWQKNSGSGDNTYLLIDYNSSSFNFYYTDVSENCVRVSAYTLIREDGKGFFVVNRGDGSENVVFAVSDRDERIEIRRLDQDSDQLTRFFKATITVDDLPPECINEKDVQGKWEITVNSERTFLDISDDTVTVVQELLGRSCFETVDYRIDGENNNIYKLIDQITPTTASELFIQMRRITTGLEVSLETGGSFTIDIYQESNADFTTLIPICDKKFNSNIEAIWEPLIASTDQEPTTHLELKQDTLRFFFTATLDVAEPCTGINEWLVDARRGDTYFLKSSENSDVEFVSEILLDGNELVTRFEDQGVPVEEKYVRSSATFETLKPGFCVNTDNTDD